MGALWDSAADVYDRAYSDAVSRAENRIIRDWLRVAAGPTCRNPEGAFLDLGCGTGLVLDLLPELTDRYVGIDVSHRMLTVARSKHPRATFIHGDLAEATDWPPYLFDGMAALFSLDEINVPFPVTLERCRERMVPGSRLLVIGYNAGPPTPQIIALTGQRPRWSTPEYLALAARTAGLEVEWFRGWREGIRHHWPAVTVPFEARWGAVERQKRYTVGMFRCPAA